MVFSKTVGEKGFKSRLLSLYSVVKDPKQPEMPKSKHLQGGDSLKRLNDREVKSTGKTPFCVFFINTFTHISSR